MSEPQFAFYDPTLFDKHIEIYRKYADLIRPSDKTKTPLVVFGKNNEGQYVPFNAGPVPKKLYDEKQDFYGRPFMQNMGEIVEGSDIKLIYIDEVLTEKLTSNSDDLTNWANRKWNSKNGTAHKVA